MRQLEGIPTTTTTNPTTITMTATTTTMSEASDDADHVCAERERAQRAETLLAAREKEIEGLKSTLQGVTEMARRAQALLNIDSECQTPESTKHDCNEKSEVLLL